MSPPNASRDYNNEDDKTLPQDIQLPLPPLSSPSSLYRANTLEDAEDKFNAFVLRVPVMAAVVKEVSSPTANN